MYEGQFYKCISFNQLFLLLCNTFEKMCTLCLTENGALKIAFCLKSYIHRIYVNKLYTSVTVSTTA